MTEWSSTRRQFLGLAGLGAVPAETGTTPIAGVGNFSWGNATGSIPDHPLAPTAQVEWSVDTNYESVRIARDTVDGMIYVGTTTGVSAFSTDGNEVWRRSIADGDSDRAVETYLGTDQIYAEGADGLHALDTETGRTEWRYNDGDGHVDVSLVTPETVFLYEHGITALAVSDGHERWRFDPDEPIWFHPHFDGEYLFLGTTRGHMYALNTADGSIHWHVNRSEDSSSPRFSVPGSNDRTVFAWDYEGGELYAFDIAEGSLRWRLDANEVDESGFPGVVRDDAIYLGDGPLVRAISPADGTEYWRYEAGSRVLRWPKFVGETAYFGTAGGVHAVSTTDGSPKWQFATGSDTAAYVASADAETIIVHSRSDAIYALDADTGRLKWRFAYDDRLTWLPEVPDDTVYFATDSGSVTAISGPGSTPVYDVFQIATSPAGLAVGGLFGTALAVGAYRHRQRDRPDTPNETPTTTTFADFELLDIIAEIDSTETDPAEVHAAHTPDGERVALWRLAENAITTDSFEEALQTWDTLDQQGVLEVRAWGTDPVPWVVTECPDATLPARTNDLTTAELVHAIADAAEIVHRAHREGVTHGGLVPESIWFVGEDVRVGDWGIGAELRDAPTDSDIAQLAMIARDLLADEQVAEDLSRVLSRARVEDPDKQYDSMLAFADALRWTVRQ